MAKNEAYLNSSSTPESDECLTPRYAVEPLIKHLKAKGYKYIWCPFDKKDSMYVRVLEAAGFNVSISHIEHNGDFLKFDSEALLNIDCVVSNPPFSLKDDILKHLYKLGIPFMILLPQNSLQSMKRVKMFREHGMEYLGFDKRICFYTKTRKILISDFPKYRDSISTAEFDRVVLIYNKYKQNKEQDVKIKINTYDFNYDSFDTQNHFASGYFCKDVLSEKLVFEELTVIQEPYNTEE